MTPVIGRISINILSMPSKLDMEDTGIADPIHGQGITRISLYIKS